MKIRQARKIDLAMALGRDLNWKASTKARAQAIAERADRRYDVCPGEFGMLDALVDAVSSPGFMETLGKVMEVMTSPAVLENIAAMGSLLKAMGKSGLQEAAKDLAAEDAESEHWDRVFANVYRHDFYARGVN